MLFKKSISLIIAAALLFAALAVFVSAEEEYAVFRVDSVNGTRWADYICVYIGLEHTGQNEWGENIVVNSEGIVTEKIEGGNSRGENLAVPEGGMVVSGTGDIGKEMFASAEIGDKCLFDEYAMRVYFSKGEINPFYEQSLRVTGYNSVRWADTVIIYDKAGTTTGTNVYGYEVCVDKDGYIISAGGNDNKIPEGGYVISATEKKDTDILRMYFTVGAKCTLEKDSVSAKYGASELARTAEGELILLKNKLQNAKNQYKIIDYAAIEAEIAKIEIGEISTLEQRNAVIADMRAIEPMLYEARSVETRSVWYTATETSKSAIEKTVAAMKQAGINELVLSTNSQKGTIIPIDTKQIPFRRDHISRRLDILQVYIDECRKQGISIIALVTVMGGAFGENHPEWFDVTNTGEEREEIFFSPANDEYRKAFTDYVRFILNNYDIDGLQLDYIRYPQFYDGIDAGYDEATIKLFEEKTGNGKDVVKAIGTQLTDHPKWNIWQSFKTELINGWVEEIYKIASELRPDIYVTAAVAADNGVSSYCQNPAAWLKGGYIDGVYVMSYDEGINEYSVNEHINSRGENSYLVMGCGAYLSISNQSLIEQTDNSAMLGADGTAYFEWGAVKDHRYTDIFQSSLFANDAIPFTSDAKTVAERLVATAKERIKLYNGENAKEVQQLISALPEKDITVETLETAVKSASAYLSKSDAEHLTADLKSACRALNMQKSDFVFVKPSDESAPAAENSGESNITSSSDNSAEPSGEAFPTAFVIIIVVAVVAAAAVVAVIIVKKKQ